MVASGSAPAALVLLSGDYWHSTQYSACHCFYRLHVDIAAERDHSPGNYSCAEGSRFREAATLSDIIEISAKAEARV